MLVVLSPVPERAIQILRKVQTLMSGPILAVGPGDDSKLILRALNEGASHYIDESDLEAQLDSVLSRLNDRDLQMLSNDRNVPDPLRVAARKRVVAATSKK